MANKFMSLFFLITLIFTFDQVHAIQKDKNIYSQEPYLYLNVDKLPRFKYKNMNVTDYLYSKMEWPNDLDGQFSMIVSFVVTKDGRVDNVKVEKSECDECNKEVIRVLMQMPGWKAGKVDNKNVDVKLYLPVSFRLFDSSILPQ